MADSLTLTLFKPVTVGTGEKAVTVTELAIREPLAAEIVIAARASNTVGQLIEMLRQVSSQPRAVIERLSRGDLTAAERLLNCIGAEPDVDVVSGADEFTLQLSSPISMGDGPDAITYKQLELRPPVASELEAAADCDTNAGALLMLLNKICAVPKTALGKLTRSDFRAAERALNSFTEGGQPTEMDGDG